MNKQLDPKQIERERVRQKMAEAKRVLSQSPREFFNPMGFTPFDWLIALFGLFILGTAIAVLANKYS